MLAALTLVFAQAAGANWTSGRPPECSNLLGLEANVWERAKSPELRQYCDLVASASSKLSGSASMAAAALEAARKADAVLPGRAASRVLEGRALAALGQLPDALAVLRDAGRIDARALDDPTALMAWARVLARTGHMDEASGAYRALLPRASALPSGDRPAAAAEAGLVALERGPAGLDEAVSALREAMRQAQYETALVASLALALALDRRGATDEAHALVAERLRGDPHEWLFTPRAQELLSVAATERSALLAFALENANDRESRQAWQQYLAEAPASPWAAHARKRLASPGARSASASGAR